MRPGIVDRRFVRLSAQEVDPLSPPHRRSGLPSRSRPCAEELANVELLRQYRGQGYSFARIAAAMNARGLTCRGRAWEAGAVRRILIRQQEAAA